MVPRVLYVLPVLFEAVDAFEQPALPVEPEEPGLPKRSADTAARYAKDWEHFTEWCEAALRNPLPADPGTIVDYLIELSDQGRRPSTLARRVAAIGAAHLDAGLVNPTAATQVRQVIANAKATASAPETVTPLTLAELRSLVAACDSNILIGARDTAIILTGFAGAFSRSELVAIDVEHLDRKPGGKLIIKGETPRLIVPGSRVTTCPIRALEHWLHVAQIEAGPVFRPITKDGNAGVSRLSGRTVTRVVSRAAERAGLPADRRHYASHSLRSGFINTALAAGAAERAVAEHAGLAPGGSAITDYAAKRGRHLRPADNPLDAIEL